MFPYRLVFCLFLVLILGEALGKCLVHFDEQHDLDKAKDSGFIFQRDSCTNIKSVGKPVTHNTRQQTQGAWMKDPLGIMGAETIFVMASYDGRNVLEEFENMDMFKAGIAREKYTLPYAYDGTGAVVYGPYLYYNRAYTNNIVKFDLHTEREVTQISLGGEVRKNSYQWGGYSGLDMAVDEQGLWVLLGHNGNSYRLIAKKIDVYTNSVTHTWKKAWPQWEMLLSYVELSTVLTAITPSPLPSTLLTTPRLVTSGTPTFRSQTSTATTPWWTTTPEKGCCSLGTTSVWSLTPSLLRNIRFMT